MSKPKLGEGSTAGPWRYNDDPVQAGVFAYDGRTAIAWLDNAPRVEANARLIAKAPLLVEARDFAEAVIARIKGEWDNPALLKWGPLSTDAETDIKDFARALLAKLEEE